jgi:hypothetical protein
MRRYSLIVALTFVISLIVATSGAQAVVIDMSQAGSPLPSVPYNPIDQSNYYGVALVPGTSGNLNNQGVKIPTVESSGPCVDPALTSDFVPEFTRRSRDGLCSHGGRVMHGYETFAFVWDPNPYSDYASPYVEQFLRDVGDGSQTLTSPYAVTTQYTDSAGHAGNNPLDGNSYTSLYGGGYDDANSYSSNGPPACQASVSGSNYFATLRNAYGPVDNTVCLTDAQLKLEAARMITQNGLIDRTQPHYEPLFVLLTPPGVEICIDATAHLCSANSDPTHVHGTSIVPAQFCSYHSQVTVTTPQGPRTFPFVVQPWTANTGCDEPDAPIIPDPVDPQTLTTDEGARLVSPLSQSQLAAVVDPAFTGWFALNGSEINDNGCLPLGHELDQVTVGAGSYLLQREFNNGGIIIDDPFVLPCAPSVSLAPQFVVPSPINLGDVIQFDGSKPRSSLLVPAANYSWEFGDGASAIGPSQVHSYGYGGTYTVTLKVTDRGGNVASVSQPVVVLGPPKQPVTPPPPPKALLQAHLQLIPQSLRAMLSGGLAVRVTANKAADGIVTLTIPRAAAKRAHIKTGRGATVVIGRGTVAGIKNGTLSLRLRLSRATAAKLGRIKHIAVTVRVALVDAGGEHVAIVAAASY